MSTPVVTLNGKPLDAWGDIRWGLRTGTTPYTTELLLDRKLAEELSGGPGSGVDLMVSGPKELTARVFVQRIADGTEPNNRRVILTDRRWLWPTTLVTRSFNLRRKTGQGKLVGGRIEVATLVPDVEYVRETLQGKARPYTVGSALRLVLAEDLEQEVAYIHPALDKMVLPDVVLVDPGDRAVQRLMAYAPGWDVALDLQGRLYTVNEADGSEAALVKILAPQVGRGYFAHVKRHRLRPSRIRVLFDKRCELRFRYYDQEPSDQRGRERCALDNVLRNPEPELTLASGEVVGPGAWITFDEALAAWQTQTPAPPSAPGPLTQAIIRRHAATRFEKLFVKYATVGILTSTIWSARIAAVQRHWRTSFRMRRPWRDRISELYPERATIASRVTGQRAQAEVYCNYIVRPSYTGIHDGLSAHRIDHSWVIRDGHAENLASVAVKAPAHVEIEDQDAGVLRVVFDPGPWGDADAVLPGTAPALPSPATNGANKLGPGAAGQVKALFDHATLDADWQLSIVLTCGQLGPNDQGRMHVERYRPEDVASLGVTVGEAFGPVQDLWAPSNIVPAYFAWLDSQAEPIRAAFFDGRQHPTHLLANRDHVREFGRSLAAAYWATLTDGVESANLTVDMRPPTKPTGRVSRVDHVVRRNGELLTQLGLDPPAPVDRTFQVMPDAVRREVFKLGVNA